MILIKIHQFYKNNEEQTVTKVYKSKFNSKTIGSTNSAKVFFWHLNAHF